MTLFRWFFECFAIGVEQGLLPYEAWCDPGVWCKFVTFVSQSFLQADLPWFVLFSCWLKKCNHKRLKGGENLRAKITMTWMIFTYLEVMIQALTLMWLIIMIWQLTIMMWLIIIMIYRLIIKLNQFNLSISCQVFKLFGVRVCPWVDHGRSFWTWNCQSLKKRDERSWIGTTTAIAPWL